MCPIVQTRHLPGCPAGKAPWTQFQDFSIQEGAHASRVSFLGECVVVTRKADLEHNSTTESMMAAESRQ
jgi:hypothetical protein